MPLYHLQTTDRESVGLRKEKDWTPARVAALTATPSTMAKLEMTVSFSVYSKEDVILQKLTLQKLVQI